MVGWWETYLLGGGYPLDIISIHSVIWKIGPALKERNVVRVCVFDQLIQMMVSIGRKLHLVEVSGD